MQKQNCKITIFTQVYNAAPYLKQCVESILKQTYTNFQYIIVDNGSIDESKEILENYAIQDKRIVLVRYEKNIPCVRWFSSVRDLGKGEYVTNLDADDWWDLNYLESLLEFLQKNSLDLAITGTMNYFEETKTHRVMRKLDKPVIMTQYDFAKNYSKFWTFPSTVWGCIAKMELYKSPNFYATLQQPFVYGLDTVAMLEYIKQCNYIGIDNTALYHYRIHPKSVSYAYNPARFDSNIGYYKLIREFLELHHVFDVQKRNWLKRVHLSSMMATLNILKQANIEAKSKLLECARIASHPLTTLALTAQGDERIQWIQLVQDIAMQAVSEINSKEEADAIREYFVEKFPECGKVFSFETLVLFREEPKLWNCLFQDYREGMLACIREWIASAKYDASVDLGSLMEQIVPET